MAGGNHLMRLNLFCEVFASVNFIIFSTELIAFSEDDDLYAVIIFK